MHQKTLFVVMCFLSAMIGILESAEAEWVPVKSTVADIDQTQDSNCDYRLRFNHDNFGATSTINLLLSSFDEVRDSVNGRVLSQTLHFRGATFFEILVIGNEGGFLDPPDDYRAKLSNAIERPFSEEFVLRLDVFGSNQLDFSYVFVSESSGNTLTTANLLDESKFMLGKNCNKHNRSSRQN